MKELLIGAAIGFAAGMIDVIPMLIRKLDKESCLSAFVHYFVLGLIIPFVHIDLYPWMKGAIIAVLTALPIIILVYHRDRKAIIPMIVSSLILGSAIGQVGAIFIE
ncbi:hypothetical protein HQ47_04650 [Porphyromonas macacae]|uniref:Uncharacterized protein n=1 Tax=Porphyromonas macacae TaxID=28115 RepID=A0A0A2EAA0_9PORP|nr:hypothetical protein [Porphyromonas macacae]KGN74350.1 hypothetical protein HQ47_04650 [Porphyromonas macacae]MDY6148334.1 hypothetical protein [Porphyromonas sp.]